MDAKTPFFLHQPTKHVLFVECPYVFAITLDAVVGRSPVIHRDPVLNMIHPFGRSTVVTSLADRGARLGLAAATVLDPGALEETLALWAGFCEAVAQQLGGGKPLSVALATTWTMEDASDIDLNDQAANSATVRA